MRTSFAIRRLLWPDWTTDVTPTTVRSDLVAGITGATVALPQGVAFAAIAGLPPQYGLFATIFPPLVAALVGSSRVTLSGPTVASSALIFGALSTHATPGSVSYIGLAVALTLFAGCFQIAFALIRLGSLTSFVSSSVMLGFTAAAALSIGLSQLSDVFGISVDRSNFSDAMVWALELVRNAHPWSLTIALATLGLIVGTRRLLPRAPAFLISLVGVGILCFAIDGVGRGVRVIEPLVTVLPSYRPPSISLEFLRVFFQSAFALALIGVLQTVSIGRAFAIKTQRSFDPNREIMAQGISNVCGSFFQSLASAGSLNRTALAFESGARTPLAAVFATAFSFILLIIVSPLLAYVPVPAIAGLTLYAAYQLIDFRAIWQLLQNSRAETFVILITFVTGTFVNLQFSVYAGVMAALWIFLSKTAKPALAIGTIETASPRRHFRNADLYGLPECPQLLFARLDGPLYFGSVDFLRQELQRLARERPHQKYLVLILRGVGEIDLPGAELIIEETHRRRAVHGDLFLVARYPPLRKQLERFHVINSLGDENVFDSKGDAIERIVPRLNLNTCMACPHRIFLECPPVQFRIEATKARTTC
jgi:SulP family sulfate permease